MNTKNDFMIGSQGRGIRFLKLPEGLISKPEALRIAAWIVAMLDYDDDFPDLLTAIRNT